MRAVPVLLAFLLGAGPVFAAGAEPEAKSVAAASNCKPGKTEVIRQIPGGNGEIVYKVACTDIKEMFVLVMCRLRLCSLLR